eukprot:TRINITY_DN7094_c0_g1_i3.p2 TRINITY_DN7094_c0_g1~~TRINITY_DN7094_c0_g1_i3.p2  ORF type:complete len:130 (+),score=3.40 TRINITY_DN7094_c0_g1_i3:234-623(+)
MTTVLVMYIKLQLKITLQDLTRNKLKLKLPPDKPTYIIALMRAVVWNMVEDVTFHQTLSLMKLLKQEDCTALQNISDESPLLLLYMNLSNAFLKFTKRTCFTVSGTAIMYQYSSMNLQIILVIEALWFI